MRQVLLERGLSTFYNGKGGLVCRNLNLELATKARVKAKCRNPSLWLATKARGLQGDGPNSRPGSHITCSRECKECEGVNPHTP